MSFSFVEERNVVTPDVNALDNAMTLLAELMLRSDQNNKPLLILGPSGVGKDTMINMLKEKYPKIFQIAIIYNKSKKTW